LTSDKIKDLKQMANAIRKNIIEMIYMAQSGHPGGSLSATDILTVLYFNEMNIDPHNPKMEERDRFILSKGHCSPALYATLANKGYFDISELNTFRNINSKLQGHPDMNKVPGVDATTGSLGQGLSIANGMALSEKLNKQNYRVYCILGDGEIEEGQVWEAFMTASHYKLDNLCVIIDNNNLQIDGYVDKIMNIYPIDEKLKAFGFEVININGNNIEEILQAFEDARNTKNKPTAIIAKTQKGKGVSFMEDNVKWHGKAPNKEEYELAMEELNNFEIM